MTNYAGLSVLTDESVPHLGGNIAQGDPFTFSPKVWDYLIDRYAVRSALDLGSGMGHAARYFRRRGLDVVAVDGLLENVQRAHYPTIRHDITKAPVKVVVDLVHCQELVEHIAEEYVHNLIESLCCGRIVFMTHAIPDQDGHHHVNCKPSEYWISKMTSRGYKFLEEDTQRVRIFAELDGAVYAKDTGLIFEA